MKCGLSDEITDFRKYSIFNFLNFIPKFLVKLLASSSLSLDEKIVGGQVARVQEVKPVVKTDNEGNDFEYQRQNFYSLVEKGQDAIEGILDLARESEHPRTYEVAGQLIKNVAEVTEKLGDLHLKMQK